MLWLIAMLQTGLLPRDIPVMSFNIRYGTAADGADAWPNRKVQVIDVIRRHQPDILGLQEALEFQISEIEAQVPGYGRVGVGRDDGRGKGEFSAVLYRKSRYDVSEQGTFWFSPTPDVPGSTGWGNTITRISSWARFHDRELGRSFYVFNLHLDHESAPSREQSTALLARRIAERTSADPVIVMGDFNSGEDQIPVQYLLATAGLRDTYRSLYPDATGVATHHGFTGRTDGAKIDHILVSAEWQVVSAGIDRSNESGRYPSDHFPVHAVVRMGSR